MCVYVQTLCRSFSIVYCVYIGWFSREDLMLSYAKLTLHTLSNFLIRLRVSCAALFNFGI